MGEKRQRRKTLAVAIYDGLLGFEYSCVAELFGLVRPGLEDIWYDYRPCRVERGELTTSHGLSIHPKGGLKELRQADVVVVPGWRSPSECPKAAFIEALQAAHNRGAQVVSVCTGAFVLGHAGLLRGRKATTHWLHTGSFRKQFPDVELLEDSLYVHDGSIATSAGSSAAIDLCLSIIRGEFGASVANLVARRMVASVHREGGQSQYSEPIVLEPSDGEFGAVLDWMTDNLERSINLAEVADRFALSLRTFQRRFTEVTGQSPLAWLNHQRIARARNLLEGSDLSIEQIAARSGFGTAANLRKHFARHLNVTPSSYRSAFKSS